MTGLAPAQLCVPAAGRAATTEQPPAQTHGPPRLPCSSAARRPKGGPKKTPDKAMPTKDQFRDPAEANHRPPPPQLPDTPPGVTALAALDVGPPGFRTRDPPTPPLPRSSLTDEE